MVWHSCLPIVAKRRVVPAADQASRTSLGKKKRGPSKTDLIS
jgi:L-lactate utilization protein LutC